MSGSRLLSLAIGVIAVAAAAVGVALDASAGLPELVFGTVVLASLLTVLRLAVRAGRRAAQARGRAARIAATPAVEIARRAVVDERARLAVDIEAVVRAAAIRMGRCAEDAQREWHGDPAPALREVQVHGRRAGAELRRMLGLLRDAHADVDADPGSTGVGASPRHERVSGADLGLAAAVIALAVVERYVYGFADSARLPGADELASLLLTALAAATIVLRRAAPGIGATACGLVFAVGAAAAPLTPGFWLLAALGGLAWALAARPSLRNGLGAAVLLAGVSAGFAVRNPDNLPFSVLIIVTAGAGGAAVAWSDSRGVAARRRAERHRAEQATAAAQAVHAERLSVARDLHDVVSHAIGVMIMQSGAALALRAGDPVRARRSLEVVRRTAAETLSELDRLVAVIGEGALGTPAPGRPAVGDSGDALRALVARMRAAGSDCATGCRLRFSPTRKGCSTRPENDR